MKSRTMLSIATVLSLAAAVAGAQQKPGTPAQKGTMAAPAISADSAKSIALAQVKGATVTSEKLQSRKGERYYVFTLREPNKTVVRATVDAASGKFSRLDKAPSK